MMKFSIACFGWMVLVVSCSKDTSNTSSVEFVVPDGFPQPTYNFQDNPFTQEKFELGRKLFYDPILSKDSSTSCGSCHQQFAAFANADHRLSHGVDGLLGTRNSPALFNLAWQTNFFWDGGVNHLDVQPIGPITNPVEMDETLANAIVKLQRNSGYRNLFRSVYGNDSITSQMMLRSLSAFMVALVSADSKYDQYKAGFISLSTSEMSGLQLFRQKCESCHKEPLFTDLQYRNNGLSSSFEKDPGRARITNLPQDSGKFKVPSLRNVELSYPYMHDGKLQSLSQVLDHYRTGVVQSAILDTLLLSGISITDQEKTDLLAFLSTLTDTKFMTNKSFSERQ
ncbi:cytochrome c peroxidase [soil metagenome]